MDQEEGEELSFVPSAISVPQKPLFRCDSQCSEKTLSFWQLASVVVKEGEESDTTNLCQKYYGESLKSEGDEPLTKRQWYDFVEKKGASWKALEKDGKRTIRTRNVGIFLPRQEYRISAAGIASQSTWSKLKAALTLTARTE